MARSAPRPSVSSRQTSWTSSRAGSTVRSAPSSSASARRAGERIGGDHRGALADGELLHDQADAADARHEDDVLLVDVELADALEAGVHRLDEDGLIGGHVVRDGYEPALRDDPRHDADVLGEAAARGLEARRHADLLVLRALRVEPALAVPRQAIRDVVVDRDAVALLPAPDAVRRPPRSSRRSRVRRCAAGGSSPSCDLLHVGGADAARARP